MCQIVAGLRGMPHYWWAQDRRGVFSKAVDVHSHQNRIKYGGRREAKSNP